VTPTFWQFVFERGRQWQSTMAIGCHHHYFYLSILGLCVHFCGFSAWKRCVEEMQEEGWTKKN
jgi:hypothetical protein